MPRWVPYRGGFEWRVKPTVGTSTRARRSIGAVASGGQSSTSVRAAGSGTALATVAGQWLPRRRLGRRLLLHAADGAFASGHG
jgi:hypothetical protein